MYDYEATKEYMKEQKVKSHTEWKQKIEKPTQKTMWDCWRGWPQFKKMWKGWTK